METTKHDEIVQQLMAIRPGAIWVFSGETYDGLTWLDYLSVKPTAAELGL